MLLSNQIPEFFADQYLWKKTVNAIDFLGDGYLGKTVSKTTVGWMRPGLPNHVQTCLDFSEVKVKF